MATTKVDPVLFDTTGTASSSTFLRGDGAWAAAGGGRMVQTAQTVDVTNRSTTSTSLVASSVTVSLSDVVSGNICRVLVTGGTSHGSAGGMIRLAIYRATSSLIPTGVTEHRVLRNVDTYTVMGFALELDDAAHGGGSVTYNLYWLTSSGTAYLGRRGDGTADDFPTIMTVTEITV